MLQYECMAPRFRSIFSIGVACVPFVFAFLVLFFKSYFMWFGEGVVYEIAGSLVAVGLLHLFFSLLIKFFNYSLFTSCIRYSYVAFFLYFIYITGGINSSFIFTLLLPVIAPAVRLNKAATRNTGMLTTVAFAALIFFVPGELSVDLLIKHILQAILLGAISYLVYKAVSETIQQNSEREETARRMTQMVQVDRLKSDFLSIAQHQLRTPLAGVKWALEMLKTDTAIPLESQSLIDSSLERVKDALSIINQMLKTVETEDTPALELEAVDVVGLVQGIIGELNFLIVKKGVKLNFVCPDSLLIPADKNKLKAALLNIIDNAIKYSPKGRVDVSIIDAPMKASLLVKDTGIGIPDDDLPYIFERLHRAKNAVLIEPDESGVGLSISQKIISMHGGTVVIDSEVGKGTTVTVTLPKSTK